MPEIEQNQNVTNEVKTVKLSELKLIQPGIRWIYDIPVTGLLLVRDKIFNSKQKIRTKKSGQGFGYGLIIPFFQEGYYVDTQKYNVIVANPDSPDGHYNQDIGVGDDISISIKIALEVDRSPKGLRKLTLQQGTYKDAIRAKTETIMRLLVNKYYQNDSHKSSLSEYRELKKDSLDMTSLCEEALTTNDETIINIATEVIELQRDYGIVIKRFDFTDIDYSDRIKQIIANDNEKKHQREIAIKDAEASKKIAIDEAEAYKTKITTEIKALKESGFTNEQIAYYMNMKNLPKNAVALVQPQVSGVQTQENMVSGFIAANIAANEMNSDSKENEIENSNGRSR